MLFLSYRVCVCACVPHAHMGGVSRPAGCFWSGARELPQQQANALRPPRRRWGGEPLEWLPVAHVSVLGTENTHHCLWMSFNTHRSLEVSVSFRDGGCLDILFLTETCTGPAEDKNRVTPRSCHESVRRPG